MGAVLIVGLVACLIGVWLLVLLGAAALMGADRLLVATSPRWRARRAVKGPFEPVLWLTSGTQRAARRGKRAVPRHQALDPEVAGGHHGGPDQVTRSARESMHNDERCGVGPTMGRPCGSIRSPHTGGKTSSPHRSVLRFAAVTALSDQGVAADRIAIEKAAPNVGRIDLVIDWPKGAAMSSSSAASRHRRRCRHHGLRNCSVTSSGFFARRGRCVGLRLLRPSFRHCLIHRPELRLEGHDRSDSCAPERPS